MITVVIPTLNAERTLTATLAALVPAVVDGLVKTVVVADGGSSDRTCQIADAAGTTIIKAPRGRGTQLGAGAEAARSEWLLFLHADTVIEPGFERELWAFCDGEDQYAGLPVERAAALRFALDDNGLGAALVETAVRLRCALFGLPYGDQGLLIPRAFYERIGGFSDLPLMEDVDLVRRIGRRRLTMLRSRAFTSAERYRGGYLRRVARNALCLALYYLGVPAGRIARIYS